MEKRLVRFYLATESVEICKGNFLLNPVQKFWNTPCVNTPDAFSLYIHSIYQNCEEEIHNRAGMRIWFN